MTKQLLALFSIIGFAVGCEENNPFAERVYRIKVINNSPEIVNYFYQNKYPDTTLPLSIPDLNGIRPNDYSFEDLSSRREWEDAFATSPSGTVSFFFLSVDTLSMYSWQTIRSQYKILKRYDVRLQDLDNSNWQLVYP